MSRIITTAELHGRSLTELHALYQQVQRALAQTAPGSEAHRHALTSLTNIGWMIRHKQRTLSSRF